MERADAHFVECGGGIEVSWVHHVEEGGGTPAVAATYKYTYISENASIWGVPLIDVAVVTLDATAAVNIGGGIVGISYNNATEDGEMRFISGDVVSIQGTTNYDGSHTLTAGTTITQLQFADTYAAETFDGTETVAKLIASLPSGNGHMVRDSSGNLYYGHNKVTDGTQYYYITKIEPDGTQTPEYLWLNHAPWSSTSATTPGLALSSDGAFLYTFFSVTGVTPTGYVAKWELATGDQVWITDFTWPQYDMKIDSDGNAYAARVYTAAMTVKCASADGSQTSLSDSKGVYDIQIDDDLGIIVNAGYVVGTQPIYNLYVSNLSDLSLRAKIDVGAQGGITTYIIGTGCVAIHDGYIYVIAATPDWTLYKYDPDLNLIASAAGPTYAAGLYFDLYGNLVVVNVHWTTATTDRFYFYDTDLNFLGSIAPFSINMLKSWAANVGGSWVQGDAVFNGELGTPEVPGTDDYWQVFDTEGTELLLPGLIGEEVAILADGVVMPNQIVDDNGRIDCSGFPNVRKLHWGLAYESKLKPMKPVSQPDMMSKTVTCKEMGISVHNTDDIKYGVHDDDMHDINFDHESFKNKSEIDGLFTGTVAVNVPDGFSVNLPLQITTSAPLPATVRAMIPKVD